EVMSEVNEILKKVSASIEEATGKFNAKAEEALKEAQKTGKLSAETKETVDKMASEFNALKEAERTAPKYATREDCVAELGEDQCPEVKNTNTTQATEQTG
ncbi:DUF1190 domain-containing protein, partial [Leptospira borgpetersenii serovar Hardjo-bovis]|nr:DUF1190 domain-containing protein [Leptospira borgpetersenii serovar Hardjo-bovis]